MKQFFLKFFFTLFLLLRLIVCDINGVPFIVKTMVTLDNIIMLSFLNHLNYVNISLPLDPREAPAISLKIGLPPSAPRR